MSGKLRSAQLLVKNAMSSPEVLQELKENPENTLKRLEEQVIVELPRVLEQDKWIYRIVVSSLSLVILVVVAGVIYLKVINPTGPLDIPDVITALGSASIGALAGLLTPSPTSN